MSQLHRAGYANSLEQIHVNARFQINSTSDPDNCMPDNAMIADVTRVSAGLFDITFDEKFPVLIACQMGLLAASGSGITCELVSYTASTGVMRVRTVSPGVITAAVSDSVVLVCPTEANLADADYFELGDGISKPIRYEFDVSNNGVAAGSVDVGANGASTAAAVATLLATAIAANQPALTVVDNLAGQLTVSPSRIGGYLAATESIVHASGTATRTAGSNQSLVTGSAVADPADNDWVCLNAVFCRYTNLAAVGAI